MNPPIPDIAAEDIEVLHLDDDLIAVNKPAGLIVHRGWARDPVVMLDLVKQIACRKLYPIHRLDRGTSGVLVFALRSEVARHINEQLSIQGDDLKTASKRYIALVIGTPDAYQMIDMPLTRKKEGPRVPSCSLVRRLYAMEYYSIAEIAPLTGRLHQIRRHLHHVDHAVIGDKKYGYRWKNNFNKQKYGLERMALHAWSLSLDHPTTGQRLHLKAPIPDELMLPFERMGIPQRVWDDLYQSLPAASPEADWIQRFPPWEPSAPKPETEQTL